MDCNKLLLLALLSNFSFCVLSFSPKSTQLVEMFSKTLRSSCHRNIQQSYQIKNILSSSFLYKGRRFFSALDANADDVEDIPNEPLKRTYPSYSYENLPEETLYIMDGTAMMFQAYYGYILFYYILFYMIYVFTLWYKVAMYLSRVNILHIIRLQSMNDFYGYILFHYITLHYTLLYYIYIVNCIVLLHPHCFIPYNFIISNSLYLYRPLHLYSPCCICLYILLCTYNVSIFHWCFASFVLLYLILFIY